MSDTTTPAELTIPDEAAEAWFACGCSESGIRSGYKPEAVPLIVAAELRRLTTLRAFRDVQDALQARADELDGGAR